MIPREAPNLKQVGKALREADRMLERWLRYEEMNRLTVRLMDDFLGDVLADQWNGRVGTDPQCVTPTILADQHRGAVRLVTGDDAGGTMALNGVQLETALNWRSDTPLMFETRIALSAITDIACFIGFTDQNAALEMPIHSTGAADTITTNASDAIGFFFDTAMATDNWWAAGVANNVDATHQNMGVAPVAGTFESWRVLCDPMNAMAVFYRNGKLMGTVMVNGHRAGINMTPVVAAFSRGAASRNIDVDYLQCQIIR